MMASPFIDEGDTTHYQEIDDADKPKLIKIDIHAFLERDLPPRESILTPWMLSQSLSMIYAWRGIGKTHVALGIAYCVASGGSVLGWHATKARKVLFIDGEMPAPALQERLARIVAAADKEPTRGMLTLITPDLQDACMPDLATREGQKAINAALDADTELIILDNLSCLVRRGGRENEAESWLSVAEWALSLRTQGKSVLFIHHSGKDGNQRGTSKREDLLDTVVALRRPPNYVPQDGAVFEIHYEKARHLCGQDVDPVEARLSEDKEGRQVWVTRPVEDSTFDRVVKLAAEGLIRAEIAAELDIPRSTVSRHTRRAEAEGLIAPLKTGRGRNQYTRRGANG